MRRACASGPGEGLGEPVEEHVLALPRAQATHHPDPVRRESRAGACDSTGTAGCTTSMGTRRGRVEAVASELAMIAVGTTQARPHHLHDRGRLVVDRDPVLDRPDDRGAGEPPAVPPYSALFSEMVCTRSGSQVPDAGCQTSRIADRVDRGPDRPEAGHLVAVQGPRPLAERHHVDPCAGARNRSTMGPSSARSTCASTPASAPRRFAIAISPPESDAVWPRKTTL